MRKLFLFMLIVVGAALLQFDKAFAQFYTPAGRPIISSKSLEILEKARQEGLVRPWKFVKIPLNKKSYAQFTMGCHPNQAQYICNRFGTTDHHSVKIEYKFEMQETEMTQAQWFELTGQHPSLTRQEKTCPGNYIEGLKMCPNHPVEMVSWDDIVENLNRVRLNDGYIYRLPTEAEWEYAARAGTTTSFFCGNDPDCNKEFAVYFKHNPGSMDSDSNGGDQVADVGSLAVNRFGLFDMAGNVGEWIQDIPDEYPKLFVTSDPSKFTIDEAAYLTRWVAGGGWTSLDYMLSANIRTGIQKQGKEPTVGFRLVRYKDKSWKGRAN